MHGPPRRLAGRPVPRRNFCPLGTATRELFSHLSEGACLARPAGRRLVGDCPHVPRRLLRRNKLRRDGAPSEQEHTAAAGPLLMVPASLPPTAGPPHPHPYTLPVADPKAELHVPGLGPPVQRQRRARRGQRLPRQHVHHLWPAHGRLPAGRRGGRRAGGKPGAPPGPQHRVGRGCTPPEPAAGPGGALARPLWLGRRVVRGPGVVPRRAALENLSAKGARPGARWRPRPAPSASPLLRCPVFRLPADPAAGRPPLQPPLPPSPRNLRLSTGRTSPGPSA